MKVNLLVILFVFLLPNLSFAEGTPQQCYDELFLIVKDYPISTKMSFPDVRKATFEQLANKEIATDYEKGLIGKISEIIKYCSDLEVKSLDENLYTKSRKAIEDNINAKIASLIDLYNQKTSYGEYIRQRQDSIIRLDRELAYADAEVNTQNENIKASQDAQRRQAISDALGNISNSIRNSRPPAAINCSPNGFGGVRCQ
jgi:hypothetical protein